MKTFFFAAALVIAGLTACDERRTPEQAADKKVEEIHDASKGNAEGLTWKGRWKETRGKLKEKYGQLTDDDLTYQEGKEDEFEGRLEKKLGKTKAEVREMLDKL